jgi:N-carbamoyl-L-amino-acid hydrolase
MSGEEGAGTLFASEITLELGNKMLRINEDRFLGDLATLAQVGRLPESEGGGLDRRPFSPAERQARDYFRLMAEKTGLEVRVDAAANLSARLHSSDASAKTILLGSHLDTVPNGGPYDGALGVVSALEVLRTVSEAGLALPVHLEAIAFTDEEGRFGDFFGSQALAGTQKRASAEDFLYYASEYPDDLAAIRSAVPGGLELDALQSACRDPGSLEAFLELHIEQGPQLEQAGVPIGIVDAIFGRRSMQLKFLGRSDHAGTTPIRMRADALVAAASFIANAPEVARRDFPGAVVTCGNVKVRPGVTNVIPNEAMVQVEFRAASVETLTEMEQSLIELARQSVGSVEELSFEYKAGDRHDPVAMDGRLRSAIRWASETLAYPSMTLSSGALHDAVSLAKITPTGMLFAPSIGGRSHCPDEDTNPADLVAAANVLLHTILSLAGVKEE